MKILIVSDTHGHEENLERVVEKVGKIDCLLHLGDVEGQEDYIEALVSCPVHIVAGNNDFFSELPREIVVTIGDYRILMTHGHYYGVSVETSMLKRKHLPEDAMWHYMVILTDRTWKSSRRLQF